jgi:hypothetical protein
MGDPDELQYFDQAQLHMRTGYSDVWNLWTEILDLTSTHLAKVEQTLSSLEKVLISEISNKVPESREAIKGSMIGEIVWAAFKAIENSLANPSPNFEPVSVNAGIYLKLENHILLLQIDAVVSKAVNQSKMYGQIQDVFNEQSSLLGKIRVFKSRLAEMIDEFEQVQLKLLGTCYRCDQIKKA